MRTNPVDVAGVAAAGLHVPLIAIDSLAQGKGLVDGGFDIRLPGEGFVLGLIEAENVNAIGIERIVSGAESFLPTKARLHQLDDPDAPLRRFPVAERKSARQTVPVWLVTLRQAGAGRAGVELGGAN